QKLMLRYGHNGFVVVEDNVVEGIISRRDIEKAVHHGLKENFVEEFMSKYLVTIKPETSFSEIEKLILDNRIGRFPVIENGTLVGIVTRTDILRTIYDQEINEKRNLIDPDKSESQIRLSLNARM